MLVRPRAWPRRLAVISILALLFSSGAVAQEIVRRAGEKPDAKRARATSNLLKGRTRAVATIELGGKEVQAECGKLKAAESDYEALGKLRSGEVATFERAAACKLRTEMPVLLGQQGASLEVETSNVAPDYPGLYSFWLERAGDGGWSLLLNDEADIWGSMRDPAADVGRVPLVHAKLDEQVEELAVKLEAEPGSEDAARLEIRWGEHLWSLQVTPAVDR